MKWGYNLENYEITYAQARLSFNNSAMLRCNYDTESLLKYNENQPQKISKAKENYCDRSHSLYWKISYKTKLQDVAICIDNVDLV